MNERESSTKEEENDCKEEKHKKSIYKYTPNDEIPNC